MSDQLEVWTAVAQLLRAQLTESVWYSTFAEVIPQVDDDHTMLVIQVPSTLARDRILTRYQSLITDAMNEIGVGERVFDVVIGGSEHPTEALVAAGAAVVTDAGQRTGGDGRGGESAASAAAATRTKHSTLPG